MTIKRFLLQPKLETRRGQRRKATLAATAIGEDLTGQPDEVLDQTTATLELVLSVAHGQLWIGQASEDGNWAKIDCIAAILGPKTKLDQVDTKMIDEVVKALAKDMADGTVNRYLSALSKFLK